MMRAMCSWVKCRRAAGGGTIFVNLYLVRSICQDAPDLPSTIRFEDGTEIEVEETPEQVIGEFREAAPSYKKGLEMRVADEARRHLFHRPPLPSVGKRLPA